MHRESLPPNVYRRTSKESNVLLEGQSMRRSSYGLGNSMAGSEAKTVQKSSNHDVKHLPRKRPNPINSLASATGGGVSEYKSIEESSSSCTSTDSGNMEEIGASGKCSDASEDKTVNKSSNKACDYWMSGSCIKGDGCQFLHSWFRGLVSLLANLKGHTEAVCGVALPSGSDKLYSGSSDGTVHVWDCHTGQSTRVINLGDEIGSLISEGPWIFVGLPNVVKAWNIETAADYNLNGPVGQVYAMTVSSDTLFAGAQDGSILAWKGSTENPNPFEHATSLKGHTGAVICLTIGRDWLYSGSMDSTIRDQMETMVAAVTTDATSNSQDDDSQEISINVNCLYFDIVGGGKKRCVYGLGSHASTLYLDSFSSSATLHRIAMVTDHVADKCIRVLEEEIVLMREN
ncbi:hypothetical protein GH714_031741 [Hevea brasiliensis]|uniref:C3H1-type domain-containing protein n=1 Tax=Hevea brasiliensis TaxID=3981 RepID=A0A6A6N6F7_HEVBR|nr:hypothetical protein GH714_031741 [Hevea brasiliensis]